MRFSYILRLAGKNLFNHKLRTVLTILGVAISAGFIAILMSFTFGIEKIATSQIADGESLKNIDVTKGSSKIININSDIIDKIKAYSKVADVYPQVSIAGDVQFSDSKADTVIYGVGNKLLNIIKPNMVAGKYYANDSSTDVVINTTLANRLSSKQYKSLLGSELKIRMVIRTELMSDNTKKAGIQSKTVKIVGVTDDGNTPYMFIPISQVLGMGVDQYSELKVIVKDANDVDEVKSQIEYIGLKTNAVKNTIDQVTQFFGLLRLIFAAMGMISVIVALLGIFNTMTISLMEKSREVGLMKILGLRKQYINKLFLTESALISFIGSVFGVGLSYAINLTVNGIIRSIAVNGGNQPVQIMYLPVWVGLLILGLSILVGVITGAYPSRRATKISPLDALRYE